MLEAGSLWHILQSGVGELMQVLGMEAAMQLMGGAKVPLEKPRIRNKGGGEVNLETLRLLQQEDLLNQRIRRATNIQDGAMAIRHAVAGLCEAEHYFHRVRGYRDIPTLIAAIRRLISPPDGTMLKVA